MPVDTCLRKARGIQDRVLFKAVLLVADTACPMILVGCANRAPPSRTALLTRLLATTRCVRRGEDEGSADALLTRLLAAGQHQRAAAPGVRPQVSMAHGGCSGGQSEGRAQGPGRAACCLCSLDTVSVPFSAPVGVEGGGWGGHRDEGRPGQGEHCLQGELGWAGACVARQRGFQAKHRVQAIPWPIRVCDLCVCARV